MAQGGNIVDHTGARSDRPRHDSRFSGIHGYHVAVIRQRPNDRNDPFQLRFRRNFAGAGPGGFTTDIQDHGTRRRQVTAMGDGGVRIQAFTAVVKAVRCYIDDAHDQGPGRRDAGDGRWW